MSFNSKKWQQEVQDTLARVAESLRKDPENLKALWSASFFSQFARTVPEEIEAAVETFRPMADVPEVHARLGELGVGEIIEDLWNGVIWFSVPQKACLPMAEWFVRCVTDPERMTGLAFLSVNYGFGGPPIMRACHLLCMSALEIDPHHQGARYFFSEDVHGKDMVRLGLDLPARDDRDHADRVRELVERLEAGEHPLEISCEMETIVIDRREVVEALIEGLSAQAWRARSRCAEALGRAHAAQTLAIDALETVVRKDRKDYVVQEAKASLARLAQS